MSKDKPQPEPKPTVENDMHKRAGVAHGVQTTTLLNGQVVCNICGQP